MGRYARYANAKLPHGASLPVLERFAPASGLEALAAQPSSDQWISIEIVGQKDQWNLPMCNSTFAAIS